MRYNVYKETSLNPCGTLRAGSEYDARVSASMNWGGSPDSFYVEAKGAKAEEVGAVFACLAILALGWYAVSGLAP